MNEYMCVSLLLLALVFWQQQRCVCPSCLGEKEEEEKEVGKDVTGFQNPGKANASSSSSSSI